MHRLTLCLLAAVFAAPVHAAGTTDQNAVVTQRRQVDDLHKALGLLQHLLETEVADALKVDLGFNANDGD